MRTGIHHDTGTGSVNICIVTEKVLGHRATLIRVPGALRTECVVGALVCDIVGGKDDCSLGSGFEEGGNADSVVYQVINVGFSQGCLIFSALPFEDDSLTGNVLRQ